MASLRTATRASIRCCFWLASSMMAPMSMRVDSSVCLTTRTTSSTFSCGRVRMSWMASSMP